MFQSLLSWKSVSGHPAVHVSFAPVRVSILVVMEVGQRHVGTPRRSRTADGVSILVVMESVSGSSPVKLPTPASSFNPCCHGVGQRRHAARTDRRTPGGFQSLLSWSRSAAVASNSYRVVLIRFQSLLSWKSVSGMSSHPAPAASESGFNPCCHGVGQRRQTRGFDLSVPDKFQSLLSWKSVSGFFTLQHSERPTWVSILVVMESVSGFIRRVEEDG